MKKVCLAIMFVLLIGILYAAPTIYPSPTVTATVSVTPSIIKVVVKVPVKALNRGRWRISSFLYDKGLPENSEEIVR
jgi:hypothetical protein